MKRKVHTIHSIVVFLLLTVGITYILWFIGGYIRRGHSAEGFVVNPVDPTQAIYSDTEFAGYQLNCPRSYIGSNVVYMCKTEEDAANLWEYQDKRMDPLNPRNKTYLQTNAGICYPSNRQTPLGNGSAYYICYTRPPPVVYDPNMGDTRYLYPTQQDTDPNIQMLDSQYPTTCAVYQTVTTQIYRNFSTTQLNLQVVSTTVGTIQTAYSTLGQIYTANCSPAPTAATKSGACTQLGVFFTGVQGATAGTDGLRGVSTLQGTYSTIWNAASSIRGTYADVVVNFGPMNCREISLPKPAGL
jgi:hypothetical protein